MSLDLAEQLQADMDHVLRENTRLQIRVMDLEAERNRLLSQCDATRCELVAHREKAQGNYWAWQGDGEDHLESLSAACPVVISADQLHGIINERDQLAAKCAEMRESLNKIASLHRPEPRDDYSSGISRAYKRCQDIIKHARSSDCGKGWISPEKAERLKGALQFMLESFIKLNGCYPMEYCSDETRYRWEACKQAKQALEETKQ